MKRCVSDRSVEKGSMGMRILIIAVMFALALTIVFRNQIMEYVYDHFSFAGRDNCANQLEMLIDPGE